MLVSGIGVKVLSAESVRCSTRSYRKMMETSIQRRLRDEYISDSHKKVSWLDM